MLGSFCFDTLTDLITCNVLQMLIANLFAA